MKARLGIVLALEHQLIVFLDQGDSLRDQRGDLALGAFDQHSVAFDGVLHRRGKSDGFLSYT